MTAAAEAIRLDAARLREPLPLPQRGEPGLRLLRRVGVADRASLEAYRAHGGYESLRHAFVLGAEGVIREVTAAKLMGRGGAAFPTGVKWAAVAKAAALPHHVVCNADESEPGTFKDRVLMEEDPFAVIESLTIAGFATGAETGWIYIRGEYPEAHAALAHAIGEARRAGFLGPDAGGRAGFTFDIELRRGAGAYICGEETALFNSIEGQRGEPRNKPPFPVSEGLFGKPTAINNVETLVNVLDIVHKGGEAWAALGTDGSRGPKLFCVSGCVETPGLYELPFGVTLRELLARAGGVRGGRALRAVLLGGAAGSFVTPAELDVPLTFEGTRAIGASLGSGVVLVFDDTVDLEAIVLRIAALLPRRIVRPVRALPRGHRAAGGGAAAARRGRHLARCRAGAARRAGSRHARCVHLRPRAHGGDRRALGGGEAGPVRGSRDMSAPTARAVETEARTVTITVDGARVERARGRDAARQRCEPRAWTRPRSASWRRWSP